MAIMPRARLTAAERRRRIIESAVKVFAKFGCDGARTRQIAEACGVNEAILYKHFPSKEALFIEAMTQTHEESSRRWDEIAQEAPNCLEAIRSIYVGRVKVVYTNPPMAANVIHGAAMTTRDPGMLELGRSWFLEAHNFVRALIEKGIEDGSVRPDLDVLGTVYWLRSFSWFTNVVVMLGLQDHLTCEKASEMLSEFIDGIARDSGPRVQ